MTDAEHAAAIREAMQMLVDAFDKAVEAGLDVDVQVTLERSQEHRAKNADVWVSRPL